MAKLNLDNEDDIRDFATRIVDKLIVDGLVPDCTDTNDDTEFKFQDAIVEQLEEEIKNAKKKK